MKKKPGVVDGAYNEQKYQESLLGDEYYLKLTKPLSPNEVRNGFLELEGWRKEGVSYKEIEGLNRAPREKLEERVYTPLWLKRSMPEEFMHDELNGEDVSAYYDYLFTKKYPRAEGFADRGSVGIVQGADLLARSMGETIRNERWGLYSYSTGGHWVLVIVSPDRKVACLNSVGRGKAIIDKDIQADIDQAFFLAKVGQNGKTEAYGLDTQRGVQCGLHSVLAAEEILKELIKSPLTSGGLPTFGMTGVIAKCADRGDPIHQPPSNREILTVRWNASSQQFKYQRQNAYQSVIARKENLLVSQIDYAGAFSEQDLKQMKDQGLLSRQAKDSGIRFSPAGEATIQEIKYLEYKREQELAKEAIEAVGAFLDPEEEVIETFAANFYRPLEFAEEEKKAVDLKKLENLKKNFCRALVIAGEKGAEEIKDDLIVNETMRRYQEYLSRSEQDEAVVCEIWSTIFEHEEYREHEIGRQIVNPLDSKLKPEAFLRGLTASIASPGTQETSIGSYNPWLEYEISDEIGASLVKALKGPNCRVTENGLGRNKISQELLDQINDQLKINRSKVAFQDAVHNVFGKQASPEERAILRDHLADSVLPDYLAKSLRKGTEQLDGAEFMTYFLDAIMSEKNKIKDTLATEWVSGATEHRREKKENSSKLELTFKRRDAEGAIKCSEMLDIYRKKEDLKGEYQYECDDGRKVDATISRSLVVNNPKAEIVVSLKRFKKSPGGGHLRIGDPVDLDPIKLSTEDGVEQKYLATSFIVHRGGISGGHYVAYVQEEDDKWYCYDDSRKSKVGDEDLEEAKKQAYVVKYSPLDEHGKCKLPQSQGSKGTANGGARCWANAAFAFALSMTSLHGDSLGRSRAMPTPQELHQEARAIYRFDSEADLRAERYVNAVLNLDCEQEDIKSFIDFLNELDKENDSFPGFRESLDEQLEEVGGVSIKQLLANVVSQSLLPFIEKKTDQQVDAILSLQDFLSKEENKENTLKIFEEIGIANDKFIENPLGFCENVIDQSGKRKIEASPQFLTTKDFYYRAILEDENVDEDELKELISSAMKLDSEFLTDALCHASINSKGYIANILRNYFRADPDKKSSLYDMTASEILKKVSESESPECSEDGSEDGLEDESRSSYSKPILSDRVEIEGMKSIGGNKIELNLRDKETGNVPVVINLSENRLLEVSSDENEVQIKVGDFRKELMDYYNRKESYAVGEDGKVVELKKEALEVLRIYQAVPSTSVALKSVSRIVVGNLSKPR